MDKRKLFGLAAFALLATTSFGAQAQQAQSCNGLASQLNGVIGTIRSDSTNCFSRVQEWSRVHGLLSECIGNQVLLENRERTNEVRQAEEVLRGIVQRSTPICDAEGGSKRPAGLSTTNVDHYINTIVASAQRTPTLADPTKSQNYNDLVALQGELNEYYNENKGELGYTEDLAIRRLKGQVDSIVRMADIYGEERVQSRVDKLAETAPGDFALLQQTASSSADSHEQLMARLSEVEEQIAGFLKANPNAPRNFGEEVTGDEDERAGTTALSSILRRMQYLHYRSYPDDYITKLIEDGVAMLNKVRAYTDTYYQQQNVSVAGLYNTDMSYANMEGFGFDENNQLTGVESFHISGGSFDDSGKSLNSGTLRLDDAGNTQFVYTDENGNQHYVSTDANGNTYYYTKDQDNLTHYFVSNADGDTYHLRSMARYNPRDFQRITDGDLTTLEDAEQQALDFLANNPDMDQRLTYRLRRTLDYYAALPEIRRADSRYATNGTNTILQQLDQLAFTLKYGDERYDRSSSKLAGLYVDENTGLAGLRRAPRPGDIGDIEIDPSLGLSEDLVAIAMETAIGQADGTIEDRYSRYTKGGTAEVDGVSVVTGTYTPLNRRNMGTGEMISGDVVDPLDTTAYNASTAGSSAAISSFDQATILAEEAANFDRASKQYAGTASLLAAEMLAHEYIANIRAEGAPESYVRRLDYMLQASERMNERYRDNSVYAESRARSLLTTIHNTEIMLQNLENGTRLSARDVTSSSFTTQDGRTVTIDNTSYTADVSGVGTVGLGDNFTNAGVVLNDLANALERNVYGTRAQQEVAAATTEAIALAQAGDTTGHALGSAQDGTTVALGGKFGAVVVNEGANSDVDSLAEATRDALNNAVAIRQTQMEQQTTSTMTEAEALEHQRLQLEAMSLQTGQDMGDYFYVGGATAGAAAYEDDPFSD